MNLAKPPRSPLRRRLVWAAPAVAAVAVVAGALVFEPWKLIVDQRVEEAVPTVSAVAPAAPAPVAPRPPSSRRGTLISHEHESSGTVALLRLADGSRVLRVEDLRTSNGPASAGVALGRTGDRRPGGLDGVRRRPLRRPRRLKGNIGSSNYPIPADVDLAGLTSVSIWCARFHVSFAAAPLNPTS